MEVVSSLIAVLKSLKLNSIFPLRFRNRASRGDKKKKKVKIKVKAKALKKVEVKVKVKRS